MRCGLDEQGLDDEQHLALKLVGRMYNAGQLESLGHCYRGISRDCGCSCTPMSERVPLW
jgi:hypothetical protein